jgi:hypothetical protein
LLSPLIHRYIFLFGICGLAMGMMLGTVPTSVPQFVLLGNWLVEMDFGRKWRELKTNKLFWILVSAFLIHVLGIFYSQNLEAAWDDVRTKLPLIFLPVVLFNSRPLSLKEFHLLLYAFLAGSLINTAWCYIYAFVLHKNETIRSASRFMSHIRLGLFLNMAIAACIYFLYIYKDTLKRGIFVLLAFYFIMSMYALGLASGIVNLFILSGLAICYLMLRQSSFVNVFLVFLLLSAFFTMGRYIYEIYKAQLTLNDTAVNKPLLKAVSGRPYYHFDSTSQKENGNLVQINIQLEELKSEWNARNPTDTFNYESKHNLERYQVLIRYLSSKGLPKDSAGVWSLSMAELNLVRNNVTNYQIPYWNYLHRRVYELVNEIDEFKNNRGVSGHSLAMRLYFWKAGWHLVKENLLFGVGTGDVQEELNKAYVITAAPLEPEWYKRPHNQYLTITVALGVMGLLVFLLSLIYPVIVLKNYLSKLYWPFFLLAIISFLIEDTLETQAGLTYFAFFNTIFVTRAFFKKKSDQI